MYLGYGDTFWFSIEFWEHCIATHKKTPSAIRTVVQWCAPNVFIYVCHLWTTILGLLDMEVSQENGTPRPQTIGFLIDNNQ